MSEQLTLQFEFNDEVGFDNFVAGHNATAVQSVQHLIFEEGWDFVYLWGTKEVGKSHLLQAACSAAVEADNTVCYFDFNELIDTSPKILEGLEIFQVVALDNLEMIGGKPDWEEALFDCYNRLQINQSRLLVTANNPPTKVGLSLPDLTSRMQSAVVYALKELTDDEKISVLKVRAAAHGLELTHEVGMYLLNHYHRGLPQLIGLLDKLDRASLASKRKLTVPFLKRVLSGC